MSDTKLKPHLVPLDLVLWHRDAERWVLGDARALLDVGGWQMDRARTFASCSVRTAEGYNARATVFAGGTFYVVLEGDGPPYVVALGQHPTKHPCEAAAYASAILDAICDGDSGPSYIQKFWINKGVNQ